MAACGAGGAGFVASESAGGSGGSLGTGGDLGFGGNFNLGGGSSGGSGTNEDCGEADYTGGSLAIPDGLGVPYETSVTISGFGPGAVLNDVTKFLAVCVNMEHTWIRVLQIELESPAGEIVILNEFLSFDSSLIDDCDDWYVY